MSGDQLARWLSDNPNLISLVQRNDKLREFLSARKPLESNNKIDEDKWNQIVNQLEK
jgi:hypothetical protein